MKKFFKVIVLVAAFILSSFGVSDAYSFVSMSDITPEEFVQQMEEHSKERATQGNPDGLSIGSLAYVGHSQGSNGDVYKAHVGKYLLLTLYCDSRGKVRNAAIGQSGDLKEDIAIKEAKGAEMGRVKRCILETIGLSDNEVSEFYDSPDIHTTEQTEKWYPSIGKRVVEYNEANTKFLVNGSVTYTYEATFFVSMD